MDRLYEGNCTLLIMSMNRMFAEHTIESQNRLREFDFSACSHISLDFWSTHRVVIPLTILITCYKICAVGSKAIKDSPLRGTK